jgi:dTDP-4-amino-4,6-dideoxygalactose transaminase
MIKFSQPTVVGSESKNIYDAIAKGHLSGDGYYSELCHNWFESQLGCYKALLTPSCTSALEMAAILVNIQPGDEVIMPSYTFVSTANAFVLRGAKIVFVDVRPDTMNIDETLIEPAITSRTKAIVPVHYAGVACDMDVIMDIANRHELYVIEDAAQGMMAKYKGKALGTIGHLGTYSFHATKNYTSGGEGGLLIVNDAEFLDRAEHIREKGTNRTQFIEGKVDKYTWVDIGGSHLPSELQAAYLYAQLNAAEPINVKRLSAWNVYHTLLKPLAEQDFIDLPTIPQDCEHNAHMFYVKLKDSVVRSQLISYLEGKGVQTVTHYVPLHSSEYGSKTSRFHGMDNFTTLHSGYLLRLPLYYGITSDEISAVVEEIFTFFIKKTSSSV